MGESTSAQTIVVKCHVGIIEMKNKNTKITQKKQKVQLKIFFLLFL